MTLFKFIFLTATSVSSVYSATVIDNLAGGSKETLI